MKKQFIPYDQALQLKELGFNQKCLAFYLNKGIQVFGIDPLLDTLVNENSNVIAPLWQQAFDWFEKEHHLFSIVRLGKGDPLWYDFLIQSMNSDFYFVEEDKSYSTPHDARKACLEKLISIIQPHSQTD